MILKLFPSSEMGNYYLGKYYETGNDIKSALEQYRLGFGKMDPSGEYRSRRDRISATALLD